MTTIHLRGALGFGLILVCGGLTLVEPRLARGRRADRPVARGGRRARVGDGRREARGATARRRRGAAVGRDLARRPGMAGRRAGGRRGGRVRAGRRSRRAAGRQVRRFAALDRRGRLSHSGRCGARRARRARRRRRSARGPLRSGPNASRAEDFEGAGHASQEPANRDQPEVPAARPPTGLSPQDELVRRLGPAAVGTLHPRPGDLRRQRRRAAPPAHRRRLVQPAFPAPAHGDDDRDVEAARRLRHGRLGLVSGDGPRLFQARGRGGGTQGMG